MHVSRCTSLFVLSLAFLFVVACGGPVPGDAPAVLDVRIGDGPRSVEVGSTLSLSASVESVGGASEAVAWSSDDDAVAIVSASGVVSGVSVGEVHVTAASVVDPSQFDVATVAVVEAQSVESVTINEPGVTLAVGSTADFTATVVATGDANTAVAWSSSAAAVASVSAGGRVTAVSAGMAVITATSVVDASKSGSVAVAVEAVSVEPGVPASVSVVSGDGQSASAGSAVVIAPSVLVRDAGGNVLAGVSVTFSVTAGGGNISPSSPVTTDADGIARLASWVLGTTAGTNNLSAVVTSSSPSIGTSFSAVGTPGAASASTSTVVVSPSSLLADEAATSQLTVQLKDVHGNDLVIGGDAVTFVAPAQGSIGLVSDHGDGTYAATYTAGGAAGTVTITPRVDGVSFTNTASITLTAAVLGVSIVQVSPAVRLGDTLKLDASVDAVGGAGASVMWSSSVPGVATIDPSTGVVTGKDGGSTTITPTSTFDANMDSEVTLTVPAPMVLTIETNPWTADNTFSLPLRGTVDVNIDWGDGTWASATAAGDYTHTYADSGSYTVRIAGRLDQLGGGRQVRRPPGGHITQVSAWGDLGLVSLSGAFAHIHPHIALPSTLPATVTDTSWMFEGTSSAGEIGTWDVSNVTNMAGMFSGGEEWSSFSAAIGGWDVSNVTDMSFMFETNHSVIDVDIGGWDVSNVTNMAGMFYMADFVPDLSRWDVSSVTNMRIMFFNASSFDQDIGGWDVSNVTNMSGMFGAEGGGDEYTFFNQDIGGWDVSRVTDMSGMFSNALYFDQDIGGWDVAAVTNMERMFERAEFFNQDLSWWCVANIETEPIGFALGASSWTLPKPTWGTCPARERGSGRSLERLRPHQTIHEVAMAWPEARSRQPQHA